MSRNDTHFHNYRQARRLIREGSSVADIRRIWTLGLYGIIAEAVETMVKTRQNMVDKRDGTAMTEIHKRGAKREIMHAFGVDHLTDAEFTQRTAALPAHRDIAANYEKDARDSFRRYVADLKTLPLEKVLHFEQTAKAARDSIIRRKKPRRP
jgi:hypothetical protein